MNQDLPTARRAFTEALERQTSGTDRARYLAIVEALLTWTAKRGDRLTFHPAKKDDTLRFARTGTQDAFWSAQVVRADAPKLEIHLAAGRPLSAEDRADAMQTLNAHTRELLVDGDRLRIGFGALKNAAALKAVLALMDRLLVDPSTRQEQAQQGQEAQQEQHAG